MVVQWFSLDTPISPTNKTDFHDITEILLKVGLNTLTLTRKLNATLLVNLPYDRDNEGY